MVIGSVVERFPIELKNGGCAEKIIIRKYNSYKIGTRTIDPKLQNLDFPIPNQSELLVKPKDRIMQDNHLMYPNPTLGIVSIFKPYDIRNIQVIGIDGKVHFNLNVERDAYSFDINLEKLASGIYIAKFNTEDGKSVWINNIVKL